MENLLYNLLDTLDTPQRVDKFDKIKQLKQMFLHHRADAILQLSVGMPDDMMRFLVALSQPTDQDLNALERCRLTEAFDIQFDEQQQSVMPELSVEQLDMQEEEEVVFMLNAPDAVMESVVSGLKESRSQAEFVEMVANSYVQLTDIPQTRVYAVSGTVCNDIISKAQILVDMVKNVKALNYQTLLGTVVEDHVHNQVLILMKQFSQAKELLTLVRLMTLWQPRLKLIEQIASLCVGKSSAELINLLYKNKFRDLQLYQDCVISWFKYELIPSIESKQVDLPDFLVSVDQEYAELCYSKVPLQYVKVVTSEQELIQFIRQEHKRISQEYIKKLFLEHRLFEFVESIGMKYLCIDGTLCQTVVEAKLQKKPITYSIEVPFPLQDIVAKNLMNQLLAKFEVLVDAKMKLVLLERQPRSIENFVKTYQARLDINELHKRLRGDFHESLVKLKDARSITAVKQCVIDAFS